MIVDPANKLEAEVSRLETLYFVSTILYRREVKTRRSEARHSDRPIEFRSMGWKREVAKNVGHFKTIVEELLPRSLRETIFVRLVSALEVFLTDVIREVYAVRRDLLETDSRIELSYRYLGSLHTTSELITFLVNKDCRALTSGGFLKVTKYFKERLGIDIAAARSFETLKEMHERRHLLVHRLGFTDEQYRHTYGPHTNRVTVDEAFLVEAIKALRDFSDDIVAGASSIISGARGAVRHRGLNEISIDVEVCSPEADRITSPDYSFLYNERYYATRDMLMERSVSGLRVKMKLRGEKKVLRVFLRKVQLLAKTKKLIILIPAKTTNAKEVSPATVERVRESLQGGVWNAEIAMRIAKSLRLNPRTVEAALRHLQLSGVARYEEALPGASSIATPQDVT
jgi:hypothetical protein